MSSFYIGWSLILEGQFVCPFSVLECLPHTTLLTGMSFYKEIVVFGSIASATNSFSLYKQQPSDPAVVKVSEAPVPAQQQKNIFQVCMLINPLRLMRQIFSIG